MRLIRLLIALLFAAIGVVSGALNPLAVAIDLGFVKLPATLGVALLVSVLIGAILGGLMLSASVILPLRKELRRARAMRMPAQSDPDPEGRD